MKTITYYGREVEVPDYAKHIAVDADGECWYFTKQPHVKKSKSSWFMYDQGGLCGRVGYFDNVDNWKGSLRSC